MNYIEELWEQIPEDQIKAMEELQDLFPESQVPYGVLDPEGKVHVCDLPTSLIWQQINPEAYCIDFDSIDANTDVLTTFLHFDQSFGDGVFFETAVLINKKRSKELVVYAKTLDSAKHNHKATCELIISKKSTIFKVDQ